MLLNKQFICRGKVKQGKWNIHLIFHGSAYVVAVPNSHPKLVKFSNCFPMKKKMNRNINAKKAVIIIDFIITQT